MAYIAHTFNPSHLDSKVSKKLKYICQSWTKLGDDEYVGHHSQFLKGSCPICDPKIMDKKR